MCAYLMCVLCRGTLCNVLQLCSQLQSQSMSLVVLTKRREGLAGGTSSTPETILPMDV